MSGLNEYRFGKWSINYDPPPIPVRNCDWHFTHDDDDGAPDGYSGRSGHAGSLQECLDAIAELIEDEATGLASQRAPSREVVEAASMLLESIANLPVEEMVHQEPDGSPTLLGYAMQAQGEWDAVQRRCADLRQAIAQLDAQPEAEPAEAVEKAERLLRRGQGFVKGVKRGGHWIGPSWGDETNLWLDEVDAYLSRTASEGGA